jgi:hypothetical protein
MWLSYRPARLGIDSWAPFLKDLQIRPLVAQFLLVLVGRRNNKLFTLLRHDTYTDKKEIEIFLNYKEIRKGSVAKSYM